jgi:hypothetical protein
MHLRRCAHSTFSPLKNPVPADTLRLERRSQIAIKYSKDLLRHVTPIFNIRPFHTPSSYRSNCDFGSPCQCSDCMEDARKPICEICKIFSTAHQSSKYGRDRKGVGGYTFTSFCEQCWKKHQDAEAAREEREKQILALREQRVERMLKEVRALQSADQVPIAYAVERLMIEIRSMENFSNSQRWLQCHLINNLSEDLQILKVRNKWMCNKERVDAMDFKLWFFRRWF